MAKIKSDPLVQSPAADGGRLRGRSYSATQDRWRRGLTLIKSFVVATVVVMSAFTTVLARADGGANNLNFATAIGAGAVVSTSNTVVLGRNTDTVQVPGSLNVSGAFALTGGNIQVASPGKGIILKSPSGAICRLLTIDNTGNLTLTAVACP